MENDFTNYIRIVMSRMHTQRIKKEAFARLEQLRKKGAVIDDVELASFMKEKYSKWKFDFAEMPICVIQ